MKALLTMIAMSALVQLGCTRNQPTVGSDRYSNGSVGTGSNVGTTTNSTTTTTDSTSNTTGSLGTGSAPTSDNSAVMQRSGTSTENATGTETDGRSSANGSIDTAKCERNSDGSLKNKGNYQVCANTRR